MDPSTYCERTCADLLAERWRRGSDAERLQRAVVLAYFATRQLSAQDFVAELSDLSSDTSRAWHPSVAADARAILPAWQARVPGG